MNADTLMQEWKLITGLLPVEWELLARTTGAFTRSRNVRDPNALMQLVLLHAAAGLSLRQSAVRASRAGVATISDVGLLKRVRKSRKWLHELTLQMFDASRFHTALETLPAGRRLRVVDATTISEPGSTGTAWRLHYSLELPSLSCDAFELSLPALGESYKRLPVAPGDVILADRGYAHRDGVAHVLQAGGDVVVRLNANSFPLEHPDGSRVHLLPMLRRLRGFEAKEWPVVFRSQGVAYSARLCAVRKSAAAADRAKMQLHKTAVRKRRTVQPETLELAEYTFMLTTLGEEFSCADVLELYRARWQIELAFKRLKSLLGLGYVPKYDPESAKAWLYAKLLAALLIERLGEEARLFSPWGFDLAQA